MQNFEVESGKNKKYITEVFDFESSDEFINWIEKREPDASGTLGEYGTSNSPDSSFTDTENFADAIRLARTGDYETAKSIKPKDIELVDSGKLACTSYDTDGDFVDIGKFLTGEPECMGSMRRKGKPIIKILVNCSILCDIRKESIYKRGLAVLEVLTGLEQQGYAVEIVACLGVIGTGYKRYNGKEYRQEVFVNVKSSREYFNLPSIAFWLSSASFLRRFGFRLRESMSVEKQSAIGCSYGSSDDIRKEYLDANDDLIYFPRIQNNGENYSKAVEQILTKYKL